MYQSKARLNVKQHSNNGYIHGNILKFIRYSPQRLNFTSNKKKITHSEIFSNQDDVGIVQRSLISVSLFFISIKK